MSFYSALENPTVYRISQILLAPGMDRILTKRLFRTFADIPTPKRLLDVGCGPGSWLWNLGMDPIGADLCHAYTVKFRATGNTSVTASVTALPFPDDSFDVVFACGLLHHLPEELAREAVAEMTRVARPHGHVVLFDPVLPRVGWLRPIAWALCRLDRGRFIRSQEAYESSLLGGPDRKAQRFTHSYLGTEGLLCRLRKPPSRMGACER